MHRKIDILMDNVHKDITNGQHYGRFFPTLSDKCLFICFPRFDLTHYIEQQARNIVARHISSSMIFTKSYIIFNLFSKNRSEYYVYDRSHLSHLPLITAKEQLNTHQVFHPRTLQSSLSSHMHRYRGRKHRMHRNNACGL